MATFVILCLMLTSGWQVPLSGPSGWPFALASAAESAEADDLPLVPVTVVLPRDRLGPVDVEILHLVRNPRRGRPWALRQTWRVPAAQDRAVLAGQPTRETLLAVRAADAFYLLDGPFWWPRTPGARVVEWERRRTLRGTLPVDAPAGGRVQWLGRDLAAGSGPWPSCSMLPGRAWECVGVGWDEPGVVLLPADGVVRFGVAGLSGDAAGTAQSVVVSSAPWCRLLRVLLSSEPWVDLGLVSLSGRREGTAGALRLFSTVDPSLRIVALTGGAFWVCGSHDTEGVYLDISGPEVATSRMPVDGWHLGPTELPHYVTVERPLVVHGRVVSARGTPAARASVVVSEYEDEDPTARADRTIPTEQRRRLLTEVSADEAGSFEVSGLGPRRYEFLAVHPDLGRTQRLVTPDGKAVELKLEEPRRVTGRVVRRGVPAADVFVALVPDIGSYAQAADPLRLFGWSQVTGEDGRFELALPPEGATQVRIGTPPGGIVRIPLPPANKAAPRIDLGDIELGRAIGLAVRVMGAAGCVLDLAGPFGSAAMTVVRGTPSAPDTWALELPEPGRWLLGVTCGGVEHATLPPFLDVEPADAGRTFELALRDDGRPRPVP